MSRRMVWFVGLTGFVLATNAQAQVTSTQLPPSQALPATTGPTLENCLVLLMDEAEVPSQEAGVLSEIKVREGAQVHAGDLLAQIDDRRPQLEKQLALHEFHSIEAKAANDINIRFARAAADVTEAEYLADEDANRRVGNSVSQAEVRKAKLEHNKAVLQIEQSTLDQTVAGHDAKAAASKVDTADNNIRRCRVVSPIDGTVIEVRRHLGEWVQSGEVVLHVARLDRLKVEGYVKASEYRTARIQGRNVIVQMELPGGEKRELPGKITFVNPLVQTAGDFRVYAEISNRQEEGQWLLQPGVTVTMRID